MNEALDHLHPPTETQEAAELVSLKKAVNRTEPEINDGTCRSSDNYGSF